MYQISTLALDSYHFTPVQTQHAHGEVLFAVGVTGMAQLLIGRAWEILSPGDKTQKAQQLPKVSTGIFTFLKK